MITVFSGTNRKNSRTAIFAQQAFEYFKELGAEVQYLSMTDLPADMLHIDMYQAENQSAALAALQNQYMIAANKFYFVIPEYNGSYPGIVKAFLDACSIRAYKESFHGGKKAALLGVAGGRAGNLRGMEHLTGVLNYLQINVMPNRQPLSSIEQLLDTEGNITDQATLDVIKRHVQEFIDF